MWKKLQIKKHFWKTIKPNFTDKIQKDKKITFVEDDKIITAETDLAKMSLWKYCRNLSYWMPL